MNLTGLIGQEVEVVLIEVLLGYEAVKVVFLFVFAVPHQLWILNQVLIKILWVIHDYLGFHLDEFQELEAQVYGFHSA